MRETAPKSRLDVVAYRLGATSLAVGTANFLGWLITRNNIWLITGSYTLLGGALIVSSSFGLLLLHILKKDNQTACDATKKALLVLFINLLAAPSYVFLWGYLSSKVHLEFVNSSRFPLEDIVVFDDIHSDFVGRIEAGQKKSINFLPKAEGPLKASFQIQGQEKEILIDGYVTILGTHDAIISIGDRGVTSVTPTSRK